MKNQRITVGTPQLECLVKSTQQLLSKHAIYKSDGSTASVFTVKSTTDTVLASIIRLWHLGYHLRSVKDIHSKHCQILVEDWTSHGYSRNTIVNNLCRLRALGRWIGKPGLVPVDAAARWSGMTLEQQKKGPIRKVKGSR